MRYKPRGPRAQAENVFEAEMNASAVAGSAALEGREPQRPGGHRQRSQRGLSGSTLTRLAIRMDRRTGSDPTRTSRFAA
jgi:hypothetical protein